VQPARHEPQEQQLFRLDQMVREQNSGGVDELDRDGAAIGDAGLALDQLGTAEIFCRRRSSRGGGRWPGAANLARPRVSP